MSISKSMWFNPHRQTASSSTSAAAVESKYKVVLRTPSRKSRPSGYSLADMIRDRKRYNDKLVVNTCIAILNAMFKRVTEGQGMIPDNLTPSGIIFNENGGIEFFESEPQISLVSKSEEDGSRVTISGTPAYMSPESLTGINEGSQFGIYTFGSIMYEMLTGMPPYNEGSPLQTIEAVKCGSPTRTIQLNPTADPRLIGICEKCMNRLMGNRYASLYDVLCDLERLQAGSAQRSPSRIKSWVSSMISACL